MTSIKEYNKMKAESIIKNLKKRTMEGYYCETKKDAVEKILSLMPEGSIVSWGGTMTLEKDLNLYEILYEKNYTLLDREKCKNNDERHKLYRKAFSSDFYLMSSNAITKDGQLINIDGNGNRVAALAFGPKNIIVVVGMNKIVNTVDEGIDRVRNVATPNNALRLNLNTPCAQDGNCHNCLNETICCQIVITRKSREANRIKVIIVGENLGY